MAAFTSSQAGNWSDTATWGGSGPPGNGDSVTIDHAVTVTGNTEVGTSGAAGTIDVEVNSGGSLTIAAGIQLRVNGDTRLDDGVLTLAAGANYQFGNGGSSQIYKIQYGSTTAQANSRIVCNGTSGSRCLFDIESGAGVGKILRNTNSNSVLGGLTADYTDFVDMGTSSIPLTYGNAAIDLSLSTSAGSSQELHLHNCTFTRCGGVNLSACLATRNVSLQNVAVIDQLTADNVPNMRLATTAASTGARLIENCNLAYTAINTSAAGYTIRNSSFRKFEQSSITNFTLETVVENIFIDARSEANSFGVVGGTYNNFAIFSPSTQAHLLAGPAFGASTGTITYSNFIVQQTLASEQSDAFLCSNPTSGGPWTYALNRWIVPRNGRGYASAAVTSNHGSSLTNVSVTHCTGGTMDNTVSGGNAYFFSNVGTDHNGHADMVAAFKSNLIWAKESPTSAAWALLCYGASSVADTDRTLSATALNTSTDTVINTDATPVWRTTAAQTLASSGAKVVITSSGSGDPSVGETRTITSNTANSITVSSAFSAALDSGSCQFKVVVEDVVTPANADYNALLNVRNGTCFDGDGLNGASYHGYEGFCSDTIANIGTNDIDLGSGDPATLFVDWDRGIHNFSSQYLGPEGYITTPADWADTGSTYNVGDRVKRANSSFYDSEVIWYRCITAHAPTGVANDEPGTGSAYTTYWEFDTAYQVRTACAAGTLYSDSDLGLTNVGIVELMNAWIREGWAPTNQSLRNAGHDGVTIGAVEMASADAAGVSIFGGLFPSTIGGF